VKLDQVYPDITIENDTKIHHYNVFMHFDFDDWEPDIMDDLRKIKLENKGRH
jgi:hypothetical protein